MAELFDITTHPLDMVLSTLLKDQTTGRNIIFATDAYEGKDPTDHISEEMFFSDNPVVIQPRSFKSLQEQQKRTRHMAEVFTPTWLCNRMNNYLDEQWFGRADVFNRELQDNQWETVEGDIFFPEGRNWHDYIISKRIEITCGEAPYLVSRYDTTTGDSVLPLSRRIGLLDRSGFSTASSVLSASIPRLQRPGRHGPSRQSRAAMASNSREIASSLPVSTFCSPSASIILISGERCLLMRISVS